MAFGKLHGRSLRYESKQHQGGDDHFQAGDAQGALPNQVLVFQRPEHQRSQEGEEGQKGQNGEAELEFFLHDNQLTDGYVSCRRSDKPHQDQMNEQCQSDDYNGGIMMDHAAL